MQWWYFRLKYWWSIPWTMTDEFPPKSDKTKTLCLFCRGSAHRGTYHTYALRHNTVTDVFELCRDGQVLRRYLGLEDMLTDIDCGHAFVF